MFLFNGPQKAWMMGAMPWMLISGSRVSVAPWSAAEKVRDTRTNIIGIFYVVDVNQGLLAHHTLGDGKELGVS
jgi:hypothetical protein